MHQLLFGTTIIAAFFGGIVALFAPCCISVMLPAYLAAGLQRRRQLIAMTFVFAAGVGTVILPIAFGATALSRLISGDHILVYSVMAVIMLAMGAAMTFGIKLPLPMIGMRPHQGSGTGRVFVLGAFSGVATACCAPVLAGVVALSGAAANFVTSLAVGVAYVFGMVAPLFVLAAIRDSRGWGAKRIRSSRSVTLRLLRHERTVPLASFAGGILLMAMGILVGILAVNGPNMATRGWQVTLASKLQHAAHVATTWLGHAPGWATALVVLASLGYLARIAFRQAAERGSDQEDEVIDDVPDDVVDNHDIVHGKSFVTMTDGERAPSLETALDTSPDREPAIQKGK